MPANRRHNLELSWPPSVNGYWRHMVMPTGAVRVLISKKGRQYRDQVKADVITTALYNARLASRIFLTLHLAPPDRRGRDIDNHVKAVQDALTHCGVWHDDQQVDILLVIRESPVPRGRVRVVIEELPEEQPDLFPSNQQRGTAYVPDSDSTETLG